MLTTSPPEASLIDLLFIWLAPLVAAVLALIFAGVGSSTSILLFLAAMFGVSVAFILVVFFLLSP